MFLSSTCHSIQRAQSRFCERRKSLRWEIHVPVTLSSTYRAEGTICNLSTGGCAIRTMSSYHHARRSTRVCPTGCETGRHSRHGALGDVALFRSEILAGARAGETGSMFLYRSADAT